MTNLSVFDQVRQQLPEDLREALDECCRYSAKDGGTALARLVMHLHEQELIDTLQVGKLLDYPGVIVKDDEAGECELLGALGKGSMGEVQLGRDHGLHRFVAVKKMNPGILNNPVLMERFRAEAQVTAQLDHPGVVPVYEMKEQDLDSYSMKLVRGRTLGEILEETQKFVHEGHEIPDEYSLDIYLEAFLDVCNTMAYAHSRGVLHRDLKPDNIMVGAFHEVLVVDWGIAKLIRATADDEERISDRTEAGFVIGTAIYMSPEQARGENESLDGRSDQYSLGLILQEMATMRKPRQGKTALQVAYEAGQGKKEPCVHLNPKEEVASDLVAIIDKATAFKPDGRYETVEHLAEDVRRFIRNEETRARPDDRQRKILRWVGNHRELTLAAVLALLLILVMGGASTAIGGMAIFEAHRLAAEKRRTRMGEFLGVVTEQAHDMERALQNQAGLLEGLASAAEISLAHPEGESVFYTDLDYHSADTHPADLKFSRFYNGRISLEHSVFKAAPKVDLEKEISAVYQLASLTGNFRRTMLRSQGDEVLALETEKQRAALAHGTPIVWAYIALEQGVHVGYPGFAGDYPEGYDPRVRPWYLQTETRGRGTQWGRAYVDSLGLGLLVACTYALHSNSGEFLGVAAIDVSIPYLINEYLEPPGFGDVTEAFLIDDEGRVVVRSSYLDNELQDYQLENFEDTRLLKVMRNNDVGHVEFDGPDGKVLAAYNTLDLMGWIYVVVGDANDILHM
ncbi:MAG: protein kinase [Proteobacteria bacterium]|jgi:eukaryotic-like serine/threonine-protein kinase|nr:protein kinase [Pseudomonadota bacterium]